MTDGSWGGIECTVEGLQSGAGPQQNGRMCVPWGDYAAPSIHLLRPSTHSNMGKLARYHVHHTSAAPSNGVGVAGIFQAHIAKTTEAPGWFVKWAHPQPKPKAKFPISQRKAASPALGSKSAMLCYLSQKTIGGLPTARTRNSDGLDRPPPVSGVSDPAVSSIRTESIAQANMPTHLPALNQGRFGLPHALFNPLYLLCSKASCQRVHPFSGVIVEP
ncbi:hypothetical protein COCC4DRAFT_72012 [Bipolaris maydis ATCC 48331]|uniref:Uncharacterized protein n=2 Tax=Cochliobolus heterostrophus TaxID=5016 RepID=M2UL06_COCH5|nr:uncharacterized protein COCC4DRAFT_72012 [Bipolaris maydis ATCC 48331]EMD88642.1 hypothetical protein COCHEDRAFT_1181828 [Bipolaris maydis C5]ENI05641.1 hypothetical protein COCC4DRAFT_72012 [Bipolaris maydis ATCC 48331]KAJ6205583.1 hypothetical protein PSV09DRAFT_1181828 [Bipolaris maydis]